jgi:hypothetical protein
MTIEKMPSSKKERKEKNDKLVKELRNQLLNKILGKLNISHEQKKQFRENFIQQFIEASEYYNEEEIDSKIDEFLGKIGVIEEKKSDYKNRIKNDLKKYYKTSPEKKGISYVNKIENPQEIRAWLYFVLPTEEQKNIFINDFKTAIGDREFFLRLWPPSVKEHLKERLDILISKEKVSKEKLPKEFWVELKSFINEIQQGKNRIVLIFDESKFPEELKNQKEKLKEQGIIKEIEKKDETGNIKEKYYEIYITPDKIKEVIKEISKGENLELEVLESKTKEKIIQARNLLNECEPLFKQLPEKEDREMYDVFLSLLSGLIVQFNFLKKEGRIEEFKKIDEAADKLIESLEAFKQEQQKQQKEQKQEKQEEKEEKESEKEKSPPTSSNIGKKIKEILKGGASFILTSIGLWGLALGWFLPLWLIVKVQSEVDKEIDRSGKK